MSSTAPTVAISRCHATCVCCNVQTIATCVRIAYTGQLQREFKYAAVDMYLVEEDGQKKLKVEMTYGRRKNLAVIRTISSHIQVIECVWCCEESG